MGTQTLTKTFYIFNNLTITGTVTIPRGGLAMIVRGTLTINNGAILSGRGRGASMERSSVGTGRTTTGGIPSSSTLSRYLIHTAANGGARIDIARFALLMNQWFEEQPSGARLFAGRGGVGGGGGSSFRTLSTGGRAPKLSGYPWCGAGGRGLRGAQQPGGGIVLFAAKRLINNGSILCNAGVPSSGTAGGGGGLVAGFVETIQTRGTIQANGARIGNDAEAGGAGTVSVNTFPNFLGVANE